MRDNKTRLSQECSDHVRCPQFCRDRENDFYRSINTKHASPDLYARQMRHLQRYLKKKFKTLEEERLKRIAKRNKIDSELGGQING